MAPEDREGYLLLVADGIGGSAGGERASAMVVDEAKRHLQQTAKWFFSLDDPGEEMRKVRQLRASCWSSSITDSSRRRPPIRPWPAWARP